MAGTVLWSDFCAISFFCVFAPMTVEVTQLMCLDHNSVKYSVSVWGEFFEYLYIL